MVLRNSRSVQYIRRTADCLYSVAANLSTHMLQIAFQSKADHPRMRAFSYACSLPVRRQRWRSHQSIRHIQKPHATRKHDGSLFHRPEVTAVLHDGDTYFLPFRSCDLDLDPMTFM